MKEYFFVIICLLFAILASLIVMLRRKSNPAMSENSNGNYELIVKDDNLVEASQSQEMIPMFEVLPTLSEEEDCRLVEIKDQKLLARIDGVVPGTLQAVANTGAVAQAGEVLKDTGTLYKAVLKGSGQLVNSREMNGAVRGFVRNADGIVEQANLVAVDAHGPVQNLANLNVANAVAGVASMVVGQYYMSQINDQLNDITTGINKISNFQDNEYKSNVQALIADVQKSSIFQSEIIEDDASRNRELDHLRNLEFKCAVLLGHANNSLDECSERSGIDYKSYEHLVGEANKWYQFQKILLEVMYKIADLTYALNLGTISRENSYATCFQYSEKVSYSLNKLKKWHQNNKKRFAIDVDAARRRRQGLGGSFLNIPALFDDDLHYKPISTRTVTMIRNQLSNAFTNITGDELFKSDVQLIAKDGKLYYLPAPEERIN